MNNPAVWTTIISTSIGAITAILATFAVNIWSHQAQRKSLRAAFRGEVSALVSLLTKRNYEQGILNSMEIIHKQNKDNYFYFPIRRSFMGVYEQNVDKVGMIGELAEDLIIFYSQILAILEDNDAMKDLAQQQVALATASTPERRSRSIAYHESLLVLLRDTLGRGRTLIKKL